MSLSSHSPIVPSPPERIVCLTEESTETLYLLGEQERIVGISGFTVRPAIARKEKPKVSAFLSAKTDKIIDLKPDLVIGFSDLQADIAAELIRRGLNVMVFNQRSIAEILDMILMLSSIVGAKEKGLELLDQYTQRITELQSLADNTPKKPTVYFEEWDDPLISSIRWVSEVVQVAGGIDCFPELSKEGLGKNRIIADNGEVIRRNPDIILGSWCGKKFRAEKVAARDGWDAISAVQNNELHEIKSVNILQPGPAALTDGLEQIHTIISDWCEKNS